MAPIDGTANKTGASESPDILLFGPVISFKSMGELRLGDVIDDYCVKCRRITNHSVVSLVAGAAAKVRCRTCYHDHDYRHEQAPPTKKELQKKAEAEAAEAAAAGGKNVGTTEATEKRGI